VEGPEGLCMELNHPGEIPSWNVYIRWGMGAGRRQNEGSKWKRGASLSEIPQNSLDMEKLIKTEQEMRRIGRRGFATHK